jgi:hypothetical protein
VVLIRSAMAHTICYWGADTVLDSLNIDHPFNIKVTCALYHIISYMYGRLGAKGLADRYEGKRPVAHSYLFVNVKII